MTCTDTHEFNPFVRFEREGWDRLAEGTPLLLTQESVTRITSLGDPIDMSEVDAIYRLLTALLQLYVDGRRRTAKERRTFLDETDGIHTPFVIGIAGSVAVGKSTVTRPLQLLLQRWTHTPRIDLVTADGFLYPNKIFDKKGTLARKGFPESYDRAALIDFLAAVKPGAPEFRMPVYSRVVYDIVEGKKLRVQQPDILIVEGLNVLQPPRVVSGYMSVAVSDYFGFSVYVDASERNTEQWYVDRFLGLRETAFSEAGSFFKTYASLSDEETEVTVQMIWATINLPSLRENISAMYGRVTMVFRKDPSHRVESLLLRGG